MLKADGRSCQDRCARNRRHGRVMLVFKPVFRRQAWRVFLLIPTGFPVYSN